MRGTWTADGMGDYIWNLPFQFSFGDKMKFSRSLTGNPSLNLEHGRCLPVSNGPCFENPNICRLIVEKCGWV